MQALPTTKQVKLVQESFAKVTPIAETAAALFYQRLFELDPSLQLLFHGNMKEQGRKLIAMIAAAVRGLDSLSLLVTAVENLGRRHANYGVSIKDYDTVGDALLWTLRQGLGAAFTPMVAEAWSVVYGVLANTMIAAVERGAGADRPHASLAA
jgi:hemoglobin-like flavoprotein